MKVVFILLGLFFLSFAVRSRELTFQEKLITTHLEKSQQVLEAFYADVDPRLLSYRNRLLLATQRRGCAPVKSAVDFILTAQDELADQSQLLAPLMLACQQSALSIAQTYLNQRDQ